MLARSGLHYSLNYRSVIVFGIAEIVQGRTAKEHQLDVLLERIAPGRNDDVRPNTVQEVKGTAVMGMDLDEVVAKVRDDGAIDDDEDNYLNI